VAQTLRVSSFYEHVQAGGLMAYAANYHATFRRNVALVIERFSRIRADLESQDRVGAWPHNAGA